jgi:putative ABC transport system ATP-binding protein
MTALVATHDSALLDRADRVITLRDGAVISDAPSTLSPSS